MGRGLRIVAVAALLAGVGCARIERANVTETGDQSDVSVSEPVAIDDAGRVVAFVSADFLSARDTEGVIDVYGRDLRRNRTELISATADGRQDPIGASNPSVSGDGRFISYTARGGRPLPLPDGAHGTYLYVHDRRTGDIERVALQGAGTGAGFSTGDASHLDQDGSHLAFVWSDPTTGGAPISGAYHLDRQTGELQRVSVGPDGEAVGGRPTAISDDGRFVSFQSTPREVVAASSNPARHMFVRDTQAGTTQWATVDAEGEALPGDYEGALSGDGRYLVLSQLQSPYRISRKDLVTGEVVAVDLRDCAPAVPSKGYVRASISDDGQAIAFHSDSPDLVARDDNGADDVFLWRASRPCSVSAISTQRRRTGDDESYWPSISGDGRTVAFVSQATDLVRDDTNGTADVFVWSKRRGLHLGHD